MRSWGLILDSAFRQKVGGKIMSIHIISFTERGFSLSKRLEDLLDGEVCLSFGGKNTGSAALSSIYMPLSEWVETCFRAGNALIFLGAAGIAVRAIAPFLKSKTTDPAVLVIDEKGSFVIPLLSGHIGGANALARKIAGLLGTQAVITTASDVNNLPAIDEFAAQNNLSINDMKKARDFAAKVLNEYCSAEESCHFAEKSRHPGRNCPPVLAAEARTPPQFTISVYIKNDILSLIPKSLILGIGCKKGKSPEELQSFVYETLESQKIDLRSLREIASVDLKKEEKAINLLAESLNLPFVTFSAEELNRIPQKVTPSAFVSGITGTDNVCERAVFAAGADELLLSKICKNGMTLAIGVKEFNFEIPSPLRVFFKF